MRLAFAGNRRRQVGAPHHVDRVGDDGAVVVARPRGEPTRVGASRLFCRISRSLRLRRAKCQTARNRDPGSASNRGSDSISMQCGWKEASTEEIEFSAAVHLPPDKFELGDLPLRLTIRPGLG